MYQQGHRQRHQQRCHQRVETHGDAGERTGDRVNLKSPRGADAVRRNSNGEPARAEIRYAQPVHQWRDDDRAHDTGEDDRDRRQRRIGVQDLEGRYHSLPQDKVSAIEDETNSLMKPVNSARPRRPGRGSFPR